MRIAKLADRVGQVFGHAIGASPAGRCLAAGSLVALAALSPAANAVVVTSPASNLVVPATTSGIYINVVTGVNGSTPASSPGWDINPWGSGSLFIYGPAASTIVTSANSAIAALTVGTVVGPASSYNTSTGGAASFGSLAGQWTLNASNYFGFRFTGDDTLTHYGYGTMIVGSTALIRTVGQIFYESAGTTAITVSAVPEPSSAALLMAGGGLGLLAVRRRRRAAC